MSDMQPPGGIFGVDAVSLRSIINLYIRPEYWKEAAKHYRADYDFFRHADLKTQTEYVIKEDAADFFLLIPLLSFTYLKEETTRSMRAYEQWFFNKNPRLLKTRDQANDTFLRSLPETQSMTKQQFYEMRCFIDTGS